MTEESDQIWSDARFEYIKDRIASAFPKLAGQKLDKLLATDDVKYLNDITMIVFPLISAL